MHGLRSPSCPPHSADCTDNDSSSSSAAMGYLVADNSTSDRCALDVDFPDASTTVFNTSHTKRSATVFRLVAADNTRRNADVHLLLSLSPRYTLLKNFASSLFALVRALSPRKGDNKTRASKLDNSWIILPILAGEPERCTPFLFCFVISRNERTTVTLHFDMILCIRVILSDRRR